MTMVTYDRLGEVATITMDDGKANVLSPDMLGDLSTALDRAEADDAIVVLTGRDGVFSAGFDLGVLARGDEAAPMLRAGFALAHQVLSFRRPVIAACGGHAIAMGAFLLLSADYRIGAAEAAHKYRANEVAIGLTMPRGAVAICRSALNQSAHRRAMDLAQTFTPESALQAGFIDELVHPRQLQARAREFAPQAAELDADAHAATKRRTRAEDLDQLTNAIEADVGELLATTAVLG